MKKIVVIGSSAAAIGVLIKLRQLDKESKIICISKSVHLPYNKCLLADYILGTAKEERVFFKDLDFFKQNNIELFLDTKVEKVIPDKNCIILENKDLIEYDSLFIGTGTSPFIPKFENIEKTNRVFAKCIFTFQTMDDTQSIFDFIKNNNPKNVTIVGAGLTGIELADTISSLDIKVNLVLKHNQIMPKQLDKSAAQILEKLMQERGINFLKNRILTKVENDCDVTFSDGTSLKTDMIIFAIGNKPNIDFLQNTDVQIQDGAILTNDQMRTNIKNIYAGGDVCLVEDILTKEYVRSCTWPDAMRQGMIAASNICGKKEIYSGILLTTSSHIFGKTFISCGPVINPPQDCEIIIKQDHDFYHKLLVKNDKLIGFLMIGKIDKVGFFKNMILQKLSCCALSNFKS